MHVILNLKFHRILQCQARIFVGIEIENQSSLSGCERERETLHNIERMHIIHNNKTSWVHFTFLMQNCKMSELKMNFTCIVWAWVELQFTARMKLVFITRLGISENFSLCVPWELMWNLLEDNMALEPTWLSCKNSHLNIDIVTITIWKFRKYFPHSRIESFIDSNKMLMLMMTTMQFSYLMLSARLTVANTE